MKKRHNFQVSRVKLPVGHVETTILLFLLLMEIRLTTWAWTNLVNNNGVNFQPQVVGAGFLSPY